MILSFEEFIKESYHNSGTTSGTYSFETDSYSLINGLLDNYAQKVLKMQNKKDRDEWEMSIWDEVKNGYNEDTHKDFDDEFDGDMTVSCNFDNHYDRGSYDNPPYNDYEVTDIDYGEFAGIIDSFKKYALSDPNVGKYIEDNIKDWLDGICEDELNANGPEGDEYEPDPDDYYDEKRLGERE